jgi:glycosyltransferase involved in cell wall biosynthesis
MKVSVVIPTHNRPEKLAATLNGLCNQDFVRDPYEIIVVDDGSTPPVVLPAIENGSSMKLIRRGGGERSAARNAGAEAASGDLLVFVDDDMSVDRGFLAAYVGANAEWPDAILVGATHLPPDATKSPFGRFRQRLEGASLPATRGLVDSLNFCAAGNMGISRQRFAELGGFDRAIVSGEDQDLALRHTEARGRIAFVPEASAIHQDGALDVRSYCQRHEWGMENMIPFCRRYPDWTDNVARRNVNGPPIAADGLAARWRKRAKAIAAASGSTAVLFAVCKSLERVAPNSRLLGRVYRLLLGAHIFRGYRKGLARFGDI